MFPSSLLPSHSTSLFKSCDRVTTLSYSLPRIALCAVSLLAFLLDATQRAACNETIWTGATLRPRPTSPRPFPQTLGHATRASFSTAGPVQSSTTFSTTLSSNLILSCKRVPPISHYPQVTHIMADKINHNEAPPSYYAGEQGPSAPKPAYNQQYPPQDPQYAGYPPQNAGYYQQQPNMGYQQQGGPYQQGPYQQPYGQPYGQPAGYYQQDNRRGNGSGNGLIEGLLAALCCCCCLDILI